jgi:hypothetical protein
MYIVIHDLSYVKKIKSLPCIFVVVCDEAFGLKLLSQAFAFYFYSFVDLIHKQTVNNLPLLFSENQTSPKNT